MDKRIPKISDDSKKALSKALEDASILDQADEVYKLANSSATEEFNDLNGDSKGAEALKRNDEIIFESLRLSNGWQRQYLFSLTKIRNLTSKNEILEDAIKAITGKFSCCFLCECVCVVCCVWACWTRCPLAAVVFFLLLVALRWREFCPWWRRSAVECRCGTLVVVGGVGSLLFGCGVGRSWRAGVGRWWLVAVLDLGCLVAVLVRSVVEAPRSGGRS